VSARDAADELIIEMVEAERHEEALGWIIAPAGEKERQLSLGFQLGILVKGLLDSV